MSGVKPLGKIVYVCDDVVSDPASGKMHFLGAFDAIRVPTGGNFPYTLPRMCVFAQFAGGRGGFSFRVAVVDAASGDETFGSPDCPVNVSAGHTIVTVLIRMRKCRFPRSGVYLVQLFCDDEFIDDRRLVIT